MRRFLTAIMAVAFALLALTYAGMPFFGMGATLAVGPMEHHASAVDCIDHCLGSLPQADAAQPSFIAAAIVVAFVAAFAAVIPPSSAPAAVAQRWREGIGKALRKREFATVILRN